MRIGIMLGATRGRDRTLEGLIGFARQVEELAESAERTLEFLASRPPARGGTPTRSR
jgi:hypothetical protein